jgi:hypothetical protein
MYTCIPVEVGVDIALSRAFFFTFNSLTHYAMDLGNNRVRIGRKISDLIEIVETPVSSFVDVNGVPVASTYTELNNYFNTKSGSVKAGEGISVTNNTVSVLAGGPSTLGGYKVGTGLIVDGSGKLSASAVSEVTKVLATEAEMLALSTETLRPYRIIRLDTKRVYYLNAGDSPAVLSNWFTGPSIETTVLSFKGRTGVLTSEFGDYNFDLIPLVDKTSQDSYKLVIDQNKLYVENIATSTRTEVSYASSMSDLGVRLTSLEDIVSSPSTGLVRKVGDNQDAIASLNNAINNTTTGLANRVASLEQATPSPGADYAPQIAALQAKDTEQDAVISSVNSKADSVASNNTVLDQRVTALENIPSGTDYSTQISAIESKNTTQDTRLTSAEASLLNKASLVSGKVPYEQLPEFPVGRKVNVANQAARLALSMYADLTIAYQSDTGDAWGLDANANPAISANWSKLGNAQAIGVASFNGRTGQIGPMSGDYDAGKISELVDKRFVSSDQITDWNSRETVSGSQTKASAAQTAAVASAKTYADSTFIPMSQKSTANGVASLGSDGKVPSEQLPPSSLVTIPLLSYTDRTSLRVATTWYVNNSAYLRKVRIEVAYVIGLGASFLTIRDSQGANISIFNSVKVGSNIINSQIIEVDVPAGYSYQYTKGATNPDRTIVQWLEGDFTEGSTFVPASQKGIANGVAPLGADSKVPAANLPTPVDISGLIPLAQKGAVSGVAPLGTNSRVPSANLPTYLPQTKRIWREVKGQRVVGTYYKNLSGNEQIVHVRHKATTTTGRFTQIVVRASSVSQWFSFSTLSPSSLGSQEEVMASVPADWEYAVTNQGGTTDISLIDIWYEMY